MTFSKENKLYRSRNGKILGVCKGIAQWLGWPVAAVRLILIVTSLVTAVIPTILIYLLASIILSPEPHGEAWEDENFYRNCRYAWRDLRDNMEQQYSHFSHRSKE
ncbi:MAG: PspC domain-containing protein [Spirochaetaceae bacterium]|jgi:phage shock protein C|nr:PspC domain-containing protein [Spirochaetaceae bacterium]